MSDSCTAYERGRGAAEEAMELLLPLLLQGQICSLHMS